MSDINNIVIDKLLHALDNDTHIDLLKTDINSIAKDKNDILQRLQLNKTELKTLHKKLKYYRYIDELNDFKDGRYLRWINIRKTDNLYLTNGGIFLDLKILDSGAHIICKNRFNKIFQLNLDECIIFQKITDQEQIILNAIQFLT